VDSAHGGGRATSSWLPRVNGDDDESRYTVRSVAKAMRLVHLVADGPPDGLSLSDLARALGASKSTTLALARTLTSYGLLRDIRPGPKYILGSALIRLGDIARGQLPLGRLCRPLLTELASRTRMTARVAISDEGHPVFIERADGPGSVRLRTPLGQRELPYACAAGKAILATMPDEDVRSLCAQAGLQPRTAHTITSPDALLQHLATARGRGFAVDDEECADGIFCVGAAFFAHDGSCAGAVSVTGQKEADLPAWRVSELGRMVRRTADQVSLMLGGVSYAQRRKAGA
jgi:IclR family transcriptional regulator, acetate operon repressor